MSDKEKTKEQLIEELQGLRQRVAELQESENQRERAEEALRESEERFRLAIEATRDALWENSFDHKRDFFSDRMFTMLGYEPVDPVNAFDFFNGLLHPNDVKNFEKKYNALNKPGHDDYSVEIRLKAEDGTWHHILSRGKCVERDEKGRPVRIVGTHTDITDLKRAEEALRKAHEESERYTADLERRTVQLQAAAEVSRATTSVLDPDELLRQMVDLAGERFDLYYVGLFLLDEERRFAVLRAGTGEAGRKMLEAGHQLEVGGESMIGWCVANKQARIALDVGEEAVRFDNPLLPETRSEMALPLVSRGQVIGAMTIQSDQSAAFSEEDITVLQTMADQLANAIENARLFEDTESRLAQLTALRETTKAVASTLELDKLLNLITQEASTLLQGDGGIVNLIDWEKKEDEVVAAIGSQAHTLGFRSLLEGSLSGWVTLHNQPVISNQLQNDNRVDPRWRSGEVQGQNAAIAPLTIKDQVMGTLVVMDKQGGKGEFDQADLDLLIAFANQAATAIENARLYDQAQEEINERKAAEEALWVSEERFALAVRGSRDGLWDWDIVNNTLYWSPRMKELLGYADDELDVDFDTLTSHLHPDDIELTQVAIEAHLKDRVPYDLESRLRTKAGQYRWFHTRGEAVWDEAGQPVRMVGSTTDITERRQAEEALRRSEERFRSLVEHSTDAFFLHDLDGRILDVNQHACESLGYAREELLGLSIQDVEQEFASGEHLEKWKQMVPGVPVTLEGVQKRKDGTTFPVEVRLGVFESGERQLMLGLARDITERKQAEAKLERRAVQLQAAAEVSRTTTSILNPEELIRQVVDLVRERFDLYYVGLFSLDEERKFAVLRAGTGEAGRKMLEAEHKLEVGGESMIGWCVANAEARIALDVGEEAMRFYNPLLPETRSEMALPLVSRGQVIGAMTVQSAQAAAFSEEDISVLQTMADQVAAALDNAQLFEETEAALAETENLAKELAVLNELGRALTARLGVDEVLDEAYRQASRLVDTTNFYIGLYDPERDEVAFVLDVSESEIDRQITVMPASQGITGHIIRNRTSLLFEENVLERQKELRIEMVGQEAQSWLGVPLMIGEQVLGVMGVQSFTTPRLYDEHDRDLLTAIASQTAIALQNARLFEQIQTRAEEIAALREVNLATLSTLERDQVFEIMLDRLGTVIDYDTAAIKIITPDGRDKMIAGRGPVIYDQAMWDGFDVKDSKLVQEMKETRQIVVVHDAHTDERYARVGDWQAFRSWAGAPLFVGDDMIGYLAVEKTFPGFYDEKAVQLLGDFAHAAAIALQNARLFEQTQQTSFLLGERVKELDCLNDIGRKIEETPPIPEFLQWVAERIPPVMQHPDVCLAAVELEGRVYGAAEAVSLPCQIVQGLRIGGQVVGRIYVTYTEDHDFLDEESALLGDVVRRVSGYIESRHLFKETQQRAEREHTIRQISDQMQRATDMESLMRITAEELNRALGGSRVYVRLGTEMGLGSILDGSKTRE